MVPAPPDCRVAVSQQTTLAANQPAGWVDFNFTTAPNLPAGNYWLGYWFGGSATVYYDNVAASGRYTPASYSSTADPPPELRRRHARLDRPLPLRHHRLDPVQFPPQLAQPAPRERPPRRRARPRLRRRHRLPPRLSRPVQPGNEAHRPRSRRSPGRLALPDDVRRAARVQANGEVSGGTMMQPGPSTPSPRPTTWFSGSTFASTSTTTRSTRLRAASASRIETQTGAPRLPRVGRLSRDARPSVARGGHKRAGGGNAGATRACARGHSTG